MTGRSAKRIPVGSVQKPTEGKAVVLIDPDAASRQQAATALEQRGYCVFTGTSSTDARALAFEHAAGLDLVLYDAESPGLDPEEAVKLIGQVSPATVLVTGTTRVSRRTVNRISRAGNVGGFLPKPYTESQLDQAVRSLGGRVRIRIGSPEPHAFGVAHIS